jgi:hypothetical protein
MVSDILMTTELQSSLALAVVLITAAIFASRAFRGRKTGCGGGCGCPVKVKNPALGKSSGNL